MFSNFRIVLISTLILTFSFATNLVVNGDFELWDDSTSPTGWTKHENIAQESTVVNGGSFAAQHTGGGTKDLGQYIDIVGGHSYTLTLNYNVTTEAGTDGRIWAFWNDANGDDVGNIQAWMPNSNNQWSVWTITENAPDDAVQLYLEVRAYSDGVVVWDDFSLVDNDASTSGCTDVADCDDSDNYTVDSCIDGACSYVTLECLSDADCSDAACNTASCDLSNNTCVQTPVADATTCDDGDFWNGSDSCLSGVCTGEGLAGYSVTFSLDMSLEGVGSSDITVQVNGGDNQNDSGWIIMDDSDSDLVYTATLTIPDGTWTYNFQDGWYESGSAFDGDCGSGQYGNDRTVTVSGADVSLDTVCWESCSACPSCTDGVQNQDETGVDCGGTCSACPPPTYAVDFSGIVASAECSGRLHLTGTFDDGVEGWQSVDTDFIGWGAEPGNSYTLNLGDGTWEFVGLCLDDTIANWWDSPWGAQIGSNITDCNDSNFTFTVNGSDLTLDMDLSPDCEPSCDPNGDAPCPGDNCTGAADEFTCPSFSFNYNGELTVTGGECVPASQVCDGTIDCHNHLLVFAQAHDEGNVCSDPAPALELTLDACSDSASSVRIVGPWWNGWDPNSGPEATQNTDGTWTAVLDPAPTENMEYKWSVDGVYEDLLNSDFTCTPVTDNSSYANRQWAVGSGNVSDVYGTCGSVCLDDGSATGGGTDDGGSDDGGTDVDTGIQFGQFGNAYSNGSTYNFLSSAEAWGGFSNLDASLYPFSFPNGGSISFTGATEGTDVDLYFKFEFQGYPNTDPNFSTSTVTVSGTDATDYSVDIPAQSATQTFSSFLLYLTTQDAGVTLTNVTVNGSVTQIVGCMDSNATNYNADATIQEEDQYGNLMCTYTSCDDVPEDGCLYSNATPPSFGAFNLDADPPFDAAACEGYGGTACTSSTDPAYANLFFSEYAEGSSNNKYLEIYNASTETVDLSGYAYPSVSNDPASSSCSDTVSDSLEDCEAAGGTWTPSHEFWNTFDDNATVAAGDVYVVCHGSADDAIQAECDETHNYLSNGDDGYCLAFGTQDDYTCIDWVGDFNGDPGSSWDVCGSGDTQDNTLVREIDVTQGSDWDTSTTDATCQWEVFPSNTWTYLGSHPHDFGVLCDDASACNFGASAACEFPVESYDCAGNQLVDVTFNVDMSIEGVSGDVKVRIDGGEWNVMDDSDQDLLYSITLPLAVNTVYTYNFNDSNGSGYESGSMMGDCGGGSYGNDRTVTVVEDDLNIAAVCWESCVACDAIVQGCTDANANNYNADANVDDNSCTYDQVDAANLFFSEYSEGSSNNKYWEIYNGSDSAVDLNGYSLSSCSNGCDDGLNWDYPDNLTFDSGTMVQPGEVFVICHEQSDPVILAECDLTTAYYYYSNGDDVFALTQIGSGTVLDVVGVIGDDPGSGWNVAGVTNATKDHTLVRKSEVTSGNALWLDNVDADTNEVLAQGSAGDDAEDSEWIVLDTDTWTFVGSHPHTLVYGCTDAAASNTNDSANVDDGSCSYALLLTLEACSSATEVRIVGPWWGMWDPSSGPVASSNGDGTWTATFDPAPDADMEYKWLVDGVQEDLLTSDFSCTPITDNWSYANRQWTVGSGNVTDVFGTCANECMYAVNFTADMNCAYYTPVDGDVVHVKGLNTSWDGTFTDLSDDDGDGVWTGSGMVPAGTWDWKLSVGHWTDGSWWNTWHAAEDLTGFSDCAVSADGTNWNRQVVVSDSDVSVDVTFGSCVDCASCSDLTCSAWESCTDVAYTDPACVCSANDGDVNSNTTINVSDIVMLVGWIIACNGDDSCFTAEEVCKGDLTGDALVNVGDVIALINIILADRVSYDDATSANIVLTDKSIAINSNGHVSGVQMTLNHGSDFSLELTDSYVSEYNTSGNRTTLVVVSIDDSLEEIATYKGTFEVESSILYNSNNEISDINIVNVNSIEVELAGPNPFNPSTSLNIVVAHDGFVSVNVYNLIGQKVATLLNGYMDANLSGYPVNFNGSNLASGVYLVRAETAGNVSTQKLMLLK